MNVTGALFACSAVVFTQTFVCSNQIPDRTTISCKVRPTAAKLSDSCFTLKLAPGRRPLTEEALETLPSSLPRGTSQVGPPSCAMIKTYQTNAIARTIRECKRRKQRDRSIEIDIKTL